MAFQKKQRLEHLDPRPQKFHQAQREKVVAVLKAENTPDARKLLKKMNDKVYRVGRSNLKEWYKPTGKGMTAKA